MSSTNKTGTIFLSTLSQVALFSGELTGQMSDGMWENSGPHDHWRFWCDLDVKVTDGAAHVAAYQPWQCKKRSYIFNRLYRHIGERMVRLGRMGRAAASIRAELSERVRCAAEYMPNTLEEWTRCKETAAWQYSFVADYMEAVSAELAAAFYATSYTMVDLDADINAIQAAMTDLRQAS